MKFGFLFSREVPWLDDLVSFAYPDKIKRYITHIKVDEIMTCKVCPVNLFIGEYEAASAKEAIFCSYILC
jgi:hypothetical protein